MNCTIEVLYPEVCTIFGDSGNMRYLYRCLPEAKWIKTELNDKPYFVDNDDVSMIYIGTMTEQTQKMVIKRLMPYRQRIKELIDNGTVFLATGNALEIFGAHIEDTTEGITKCLGIFDLTTKRDEKNRIFSLVLGNHEDLEMVGFRAQFTQSFITELDKPFLNVTRGLGMNEKSNIDGIQKNNFYGTYLLGPILVLNPYFTKNLIKKIIGEDVHLALEENVIAAYNKRLEEFKDSKVHIH